MNDEKYTCHICGEDMFWTGNAIQNPNENRWCSILYVYQCKNIDCRHKSKYDKLDSSGERFLMMQMLEDCNI